MDNHSHEKENNEGKNSNAEYLSTNCQKSSTRPYTQFKIAPISQNLKSYESKKVDNPKQDHEESHLNANTEYLPTKCRITKPPPPKPATNPQQFIKVGPCPLFQKACEQIKKVEEIKKERKEIRDETEDWQQNLDNWKSSRRKRQEHIIERVVEVKKMEQEEHEKSRRKSKTFSEMLEDRKGRHKFVIPVYDDDSNDLSDYGIGSSSSKTNSIKDVDTDDSSSILDEKDSHSFDSPSNKDSSSASNQSHSEDESTMLSKKDSKNNSTFTNNNSFGGTNSSNNVYTTGMPKLSKSLDTKSDSTQVKETEQYTYEGAIQDYRSRIQSKMNVDESIFTKNKDVSKSKEYSEAQTVLAKGEIFKRKELFDKPVEINNFESTAVRRLSEDFANTRSIKERLQSLEKSTDQSIKCVDKGDIQISVKQRLENFNKQTDIDSQNNNLSRKAQPVKISNLILNKSSSQPNFRSTNNTDVDVDNYSNRSSSPETELYMNKLNMFNRDLDNLMNGKSLGEITEHEEYYPPSVSSTELMGLSSDREDSGIHTADVSCSVSQADTDTEVSNNTIPICIEKLKMQKEEFENITTNSDKTDVENQNNNFPTSDLDDKQQIISNAELIKCTVDLLDSLKLDASENFEAGKEFELKKNNQSQTVITEVVLPEIQEQIKSKPVLYQSIEPLENYPIEFITDDLLVDAAFPSNSSVLEPPKVKPPPPPPSEVEEKHQAPIKRLNSTKRLKKEILIKRSSFLGLDEPTDDQIDPEVPIDKPPDITTFLQKESKLEKSMYKKMQEEIRMEGNLSKVESQDSGLDIDRGRLSSDTWVSSIGDSSNLNNEHHDSEQANSFTSEEEEIIKKEREIIAMVEKEEKSRDTVEFIPVKKEAPVVSPSFKPLLENEHFKESYYPQEKSVDYPDDQEVLKIEQELRQLEKEELERQHEDMLFRESRAKARLQNNRHSLENIFDEMNPPYYPPDGVNYRKSMPELLHVPRDYRQSVPEVPSVYNSYRRSGPDNMDIQHRKSMPDIQHAHTKSIPDRYKPVSDNNMQGPLNHRKSMPELQHDSQRSAFKSPPAVSRQPILPGKPLRPLKEPSMFTPIHSEGNKDRPVLKNNVQALSAAPRPRHIPSDQWIQPKAKGYNEHWLYQEAELRRLMDQQKNAAANRNWQQPRPENSPNKQEGYIQPRPYLGHPQTVGHALRMPYVPPTGPMEDSQDRMLSVSGKKKCSYCNNELGRGAAMIIESLCLFYHMECFKCCVCHVQLGDGLMGTDVRVRNQKLHCHNCYSSDDGVKFSCV